MSSPSAKWCSLGALFAGLLASLFLGDPAGATEHCSITAEIRAAASQPIANTIAARSDREIRITRAVERAAASLADSYLRGGSIGKEEYACLSELEESGRFLQVLQYELFRSSVERLRGSGDPTLLAFLRLYDARFTPDSPPLFRFAGFDYGPAPAGLPAGFHRGAGGMFFDLSQISSQEWMLIFVHELFHALDTELTKAVAEYSDAAAAARMVTLSQSHATWAELSEAEKSQARTWIQSGLGRGLWAEWRAWAATLRIYDAGKAAGTWNEIGWLENLDRDGGSLQTLYAYLDERAPPPEEVGMFSHSLLRDAEREVRNEMRAQHQLPPMGALTSIPAQERVADGSREAVRL